MTDLDGNAAVAFDERVLSGKVLDVVRELLLEPGHTDEVLMIIARLVHRNEDLERLVLQLRNAKNRHEHLSRAQLALFITQAARAATDPELSAADEGLAGAAQPMIDDKNAEEEKAKSSPKPPPPRGPRELPAKPAGLLRRRAALRSGRPRAPRALAALVLRDSTPGPRRASCSAPAGA